jgi:hypothetical protein
MPGVGQGEAAFARSLAPCDLLIALLVPWETAHQSGAVPGFGSLTHRGKFHAHAGTSSVTLVAIMLISPVALAFGCSDYGQE